MGKSRDIADGTRYVDASGDTMTGEIDVTTGGYTARGLELPRVGINIGSAQFGYDGSNGVIRTWASSPIKYQTYGTHQFEIAGIKRMEIDGAGRVTTPYQPAFSARKTTITNSLTGATVYYDLVCQAAELNVGNHFSTTTGRFTAPVSGTYMFTAHVLFTTQASGRATEFWVSVNDDAQRWFLDRKILSSTTENMHTVTGSVAIKLVAGDYVIPSGFVLGGAQDVGIQGAGTVGSVVSNFSGYLVG